MDLTSIIKEISKVTQHTINNRSINFNKINRAAFGFKGTIREKGTLNLLSKNNSETNLEDFNLYNYFITGGSVDENEKIIFKNFLKDNIVHETISSVTALKTIDPSYQTIEPQIKEKQKQAFFIDVYFWNTKEGLNNLSMIWVSPTNFFILLGDSFLKKHKIDLTILNLDLNKKHSNLRKRANKIINRLNKKFHLTKIQ